jgi:AcrR family transcriptional regulator
MKSDAALTRPYRQKARAHAAAKNGERILDAFIGRLQAGWFEEIRLDDVASEAGVTVQTVIRRFGGKEGLLESSSRKVHEEIRGARETSVSDPASAVRTVVAEYERREAHDSLVIALDVFTWRLVRIDMGRSKAALFRIMIRMCAAAIGVDPIDLERTASTHRETVDG